MEEGKTKSIFIIHQNKLRMAKRSNHMLEREREGKKEREGGKEEEREEGRKKGRGKKEGRNHISSRKNVGKFPYNLSVGKAF